MIVSRKWDLVGIFDDSRLQHLISAWLYQCIRYRIGKVVDRIINKNYAEFNAIVDSIECSPADRKELFDYLAIEKCVEKLAMVMYENGQSGRRTWKLSSCTPFPVRVKHIKPFEVRTCDQQMCPWCHARKIKKIFRSLKDASFYSIAIKTKLIESSDIPLKSQVEDFKRQITNIRQRIGPPYTATFQVIPDPYSAGWLLRGAILLPADVKVKKRDFTLIYPKSKFSTLSKLYPYPSQYLLLSGDVAAKLSNCLTHQRSLVTTADCDYGLGSKIKR
jgi:hypothetical protein